MKGHTVANAPSSAQDSYLASVSDLMVGLLFVFIIILMSFALRLREAETLEDEAKKQAETASEVLSTITDDLVEDMEVRNHLLKEIAESLRQQGVQVHLDLRNGVLRLPEELLFDSGSADFRDEGQRAVEILGGTLAELLPCYGEREETRESRCGEQRSLRLDAVFVEGHTDNVDIHTAQFPNNWALSYARAHRTYQDLMARAPSLKTLKNGQNRLLFSMSAYADTRPVAGNDTEEGRRQNRRIDLRFILATPDEGELVDVRRRLQAPGYPP
jgi:chemotaxis protein MotB